jgi:hypothetical protein
MPECLAIVAVGLMGQAFSRHPTLRLKAEGGPSHHPAR